MGKLSAIAAYTRSGLAYTRARWQLRGVKAEPLLIGVTHHDAMLPYGKMMVRTLRAKGHSRLGLEIPLTHPDGFKPAFFFPLKTFAEKLGYTTIALDVPYTVDFYHKRAGAMLALDALEEACGDVPKAMETIEESYNLHRDLLLKAASIGNIGDLNYVDHSLYFPYIREFFNYCHAKKLLEEEQPAKIREIAQEANDVVNQHMLDRIQSEHPDVSILGYAHTRALQGQLSNHLYIEMKTPVRDLQV